MNINEQIEEHYKKYGDKVLFNKNTYDMQRGRSTRYAYSRLKDWQLAEEAVQETYARILKYPPKDSTYSFGGIFKVVLDRRIAIIRDLERRKGIVIKLDKQESDTHNVDKTPSEDLTPERILQVVELTELVMDLSEKLPPKKKSIVRLSLIFNYSYSEIMHFTNVDAKMISNVIFRFRVKVRESSRYEDICI